MCGTRLRTDRTAARGRDHVLGAFHNGRSHAGQLHAESVVFEVVISRSSSRRGVSIAGQLNAREHVSHYEPRSSEGLVALLEHDERYDVRHDSCGLPIIRLV